MTALQDPPRPDPEVRTSARTRPAQPPRARFEGPRRGTPGWTVRAILLWLAAITLGLSLDIVLVSQIQYQATQSRDFATLRNSLELATAPVSQTDPDGNLTPTGTPVALLSIPAIGLRDTVVVEGTSAETLQRGPGHQRDTVFPGQPGVSILQGRAAAFGGPFGEIGRLKTGDTISVTTGQGQADFRVLGQRREGQPVPAYRSGTSRLTLVTAGGLPFVPHGLIYVDAVFVGDNSAFEPSVVYARDLPTDEQPLGTMPGTLPTTILVLQALVLVVLLGVWGWLRWGRSRTWIALGPVLVLAVVFVGGRITLLLPNLL